MTANEKRQRVVDKYSEIQGRNIYSQRSAQRECAFHPYKDGKYYSDCSSSVRLSYKEADIGIDNIGSNTVAQYGNKKGQIVDVKISNGLPTDISKLRIGDCFYFAGTDSGRKYAGYVGHVEMVAKINGSSVTLYGHGSGNPSAKDMKSYCTNRYRSKTSTPLGNKGLIRIIRWIPDDGSVTIPTPTPEYQLGDRTLRSGDKGNDVAKLQQALNTLGYNAGTVDGKFGSKTKNALKAFQRDHDLDVDGIYGEKSHAALTQAMSGESGSTNGMVLVTGGSVNVRKGEGTNYGVMRVVHKGDTFPWLETGKSGWNKIRLTDGREGWISNKYSRVV